MPRYFFPCIGLTPDFSTEFIQFGDHGIHRRLWDTTPFDVATLAVNHKVNFSYFLMTAFLERVNCEIAIAAKDIHQAQEEARLIQSMLYLEGIGPFIMPFFTDWSLNLYSGINSRDSKFLSAKLPNGLREGLKSDYGKLEAWLHEPTLKILALANRSRVSSEIFERASLGANEWRPREKAHPNLSAVRASLQTSPMIPDISSSLLHIWQGIESLFPNVTTEVSFRISLLIAQLCSDAVPSNKTYEKARRSYNHRSSAAHGNSKKIGPNEWSEAWELLVSCMISIRRRNTNPNEQDLIAELLHKQ